MSIKRASLVIYHLQTRPQANFPAELPPRTTGNVAVSPHIQRELMAQMLIVHLQRYGQGGRNLI